MAVSVAISTMKEHWFLIILIIILLTLILFEPLLGWRAARFFASFDDGKTRYRELIFENQVMKTEIAKLEAIKDQSPRTSFDITRAMVFTRYPFNLKGELLVDAGADKGVKIGQAVLVFNENATSTFSSELGGVLIGKISRVFVRAAAVETVFDKNWRSSVRVGKKGYIALLEGGSEPKATLISKEAILSTGDIVYSVDPSIPHSLPIGEVQNIGQTADQVFQEASIRLVYDFNSVMIVGILK